MEKKNRGQSVLEYVIILTAIVAALIAFAFGKIGGGSAQDSAVAKMLGDAQKSITHSSGQLPK